MGWIYLISNRLTGSVYVGQTKTKVGHRFARHKYDGRRRNTPLYNSARSYGWENFSIEEVCAAPCNELDRLEQGFIAALRFVGCRLYNITEGGRPNREFSPSGRARLRNAGNWKKGQVAWNKGKKCPKSAMFGERNPAKRRDVRERIAKTLKAKGILPPMYAAPCGELNPNFGGKSSAKAWETRRKKKGG